MKVLVYAKNKTKPLELLLRVVSRIISANDFKEISSIDALCRQLKNNTITQNNMTLTILLIEDHEELRNLLIMQSQLKETRIILILPDKKLESINMGHALFPRYLDFTDSNFTEVGEVLKKIKDKSHWSSKSEYNNYQ